MIKYPIGIQSFEKLREDGYVYVDKTELIYNLVHGGTIYQVREEFAGVHPEKLFPGPQGPVRGTGHQLAGEGMAGVSGVQD